MTTPTPQDMERAREQRCREFLREVFGGDHHVRQRGVKVEPFGQLSYCFLADCATFDGDLLTRIVVCAHKHRVRAEISPAGTRLKLWMSARTDEGRMHERHPGMEALAAQAIADERERCAKRGGAEAVQWVIDNCGMIGSPDQTALEECVAAAIRGGGDHA